MATPEQQARFVRDLERLAGAGQPRVGIAVSGGPDSLALLILAAATHAGRVAAATVDHGLRRESASEAAHVAAICAKLGVAHETLTVDVAAGGDGLQGEARRARYRALEAWAAQADIPFLLTAHHADDQAETLLMRLARGAGLSGLAGVRARRPLSEGVTLLRPLLGWRRAELEEIARPFAPVDDPSNRDMRFDRVRMRDLLRGADVFDPLALARSAAALAQSEQALDWAARRLWDERAVCEGAGVTLDPAGVPAELRRRLVLKALSAAGGGVPRGDEVQRLLAALEERRTATLSGVKCAGGDLWRFAPAPPRSAGRSTARSPRQPD